MQAFADPLIPLLQLRRDVLEGSPIDPTCLDNGYLKLNQDFPNGGKRFCFAKIHSGAPVALAIFGLESPIEGIRCYSVGYAVIEELRGRGLALEAVNRGLSALKIELLKKPFDLVFTLDENEWNGNTTLQLKVIDLRSSEQ